MIRCKVCKKFAKVTKVKMNTFTDRVIAVYGSCSYCKFKDSPNMIDYDDFEELGIKN